MLTTSPAFSSFSVRDIEESKRFYSETLGLKTKVTKEGLELHIQDSIPVFLYPKPDHVPATFTVLNFPVEDTEKTVDALIAKGIVFEQYNMEYIKTDEKGISWNKSDMGPSSQAWFKDPSGNFLSVLH